MVSPYPWMEATLPSNNSGCSLTNCLSHEDSTLLKDEYKWLTMRAKGGFGMTMTCATNVHADGKGFPGQLGVYSDKHIAGLTRLATGLKQENVVSSLQLYHVGLRVISDLNGEHSVGPSDDQKTGVRALTRTENEVTN